MLHFPDTPVTRSLMAMICRDVCRLVALQHHGLHLPLEEGLSVHKLLGSPTRNSDTALGIGEAANTTHGSEEFDNSGSGEGTGGKQEWWVSAVHCSFCKWWMASNGIPIQGSNLFVQQQEVQQEIEALKNTVKSAGAWWSSVTSMFGRSPRKAIGGYAPSAPIKSRHLSVLQVLEGSLAVARSRIGSTDARLVDLIDRALSALSEVPRG